MLLKDCQVTEKRKGWYYLEFLYVEKSYTIGFEVEFVIFNIRITDGDRFIALSHLKEYDNPLNQSAIREALLLLQELLKETIYFLVKRNGRLYKETASGTLKRIKPGDLYKKRTEEQQ